MVRFALYQVAPQSFPDADELLVDDLLLLLEDFFEDDDEVFEVLRDDATLLIDELLITTIIDDAELLLMLRNVEALLLTAIEFDIALLFVATLVFTLELDKAPMLDVTATIELVVCLSPPESLPPPQAVKFMAKVIQRVA